MPLNFNTFNLLHADVTCKLGYVADHTLYVEFPKLGFSLVGLPGETERPFNLHRVLLGAFSFVLRSFSPEKKIGMSN